MTRDQITPPQLSGLPIGTPVALIGSPQGYALAVGEADRVRWLHTTTGSFRLFLNLGPAVALLRQYGIRRFTIDITGGIPQ